MASKWCSRCGTSHGPGRSSCPGDLHATEPERHGWRATAETPTGIEAYGVLLAPCEQGWRARILTYPNVLWTVPGGRVSMKFVAGTPREAEQRAVRFLEAHVARRGLLLRKALEPVEPGPIRLEDHGSGKASVPDVRPGVPARRKLRSIPLLYGPTRPQVRAVTANLSETGMFITTERPLNPGSPIVVELETESCSVRVKGTVVWRRVKTAFGRLPGMGIRLEAPPPLYTQYVRQIP
jgi:hypothetical protein